MAPKRNTSGFRKPISSLYPIPEGANEEALVMLNDILPPGLECGVLNGKVAPGNTVAIVGSGPIGLAALLKAQFYSPAEIIMVDVDDRFELDSGRIRYVRKMPRKRCLESHYQGS